MFQSASNTPYNLAVETAAKQTGTRLHGLKIISPPRCTLPL